MATQYDFSQGLPDTSALSTKERMEVLREYRLFKAQAPTFDFSAGPPDVTSLDGTERLNVMRQYRQWQQQQSTTPAPAEMPYAGTLATKRDDAPSPRAATPRATREPAPWLPAVAPAEAEPSAENMSPAAAAPTPPGSAAGVASRKQGNVFTYFERALLSHWPPHRHTRTRAHARCPPGLPPGPRIAAGPQSARPYATRCTEESADVAPPTPRTLRAMNTNLREGAIEGAAGMHSSSVASSAAWLDNETPRHTRQLIPKEMGVTDKRVFASDVVIDESVADTTKARAERLRALRQKDQADQMVEGLAAVNVGQVAGAPTPIEPAAAAAVAPVAPAEPVAPSAPSTVGMSRGAALESKRQWRLQLMAQGHGTAVGIPSPGAKPSSPAGMASSFRSHSVRGAVGELDHTSAADYNLQVKIQRDVSTPRGSSLAPWLGGGEKLSYQPSPTPLGQSNAGNQQAPGEVALPMSAALDGAMPSVGLSPLSHADKLARMKEMRHGIMTPRDVN